MISRNTIIISVAAATVGAAAYGTAAALDDPGTSVESVQLDVAPARTSAADVAGPDTTPTPEPATTVASTANVQGLSQLEGQLRRGDDLDDWYLSGVDLDFGPEEWFLTEPLLDDFDRDGAVEPLTAELEGLLGAPVTVGVRYETDDDDRDDADVYTIAGLTFRDPSRPAPWVDTSDRADADRSEIAVAAAAAVGPNAIVDDLDREDEDGWTGWKADVTDAGGREYDVLLDDAGTVLDVQPD